MNDHFVLCFDGKQADELIKCGFELLFVQGATRVFINNKALFDEYTSKGKKLITTNTLTF